ncbi:hypothetical protein G9A89_003277 [Geosiphon pyriformis]|nr:hypothetical protein G9A89_003277 [Geosiphon pyriformis]
MASFHIIEPTKLPLLKQRHLFATRTRQLNGIIPSLSLLKQWVVSANSTSEGVFLASPYFLDLSPPPLDSSFELGDPEVWQRHCQMKTVDTGRYQCFRLPEKITIESIPEVVEGSNIVDKILTHVGTMIVILSNRYENESTFPVIAVDLPLSLMEIVIRRASLKYVHMLPSFYPCKKEEEEGCMFGIEAELKKLKFLRKEMCKKLGGGDDEKSKRYRFLYREFRDRMHVLRREADPGFFICFSLIDDEPIIVWLRQRENTSIMKYLPGFWTGRKDEENDQDVRQFFWPRFDHHKDQVRVPQQLCNNIQCEKSQGDSFETEVLTTFYDYRRKQIDEEGNVIDKTLENEEKALAALVELNMCSRCKKALYCGVECQKSDYKRHKMVCIAPTR